MPLEEENKANGSSMKTILEWVRMEDDDGGGGERALTLIVNPNPNPCLLAFLLLPPIPSLSLSVSFRWFACHEVVVICGDGG